MFGEAGHKILHRARSLRRLRPHDEPSRAHNRGVSISSDASRASSSGSDTTSRRGHSVEWDPLHMHPSMEVDRSPHMTPPYYHGAPARHARHHHHQESESEPEPEPAVPPRPAFAQGARTARRPGVDTHAWAGFDFGFDDDDAEPQLATGLSPHSRMMRAQKSEADLKRKEAAAAGSPKAGGPHEGAAPRWNGLHSPARRQAPDAGLDEADYFLRRGGWKRRGIVFGLSSADTHGSEDDCFDI